MERKIYTGEITELEPHQIFVFGSNTQGRHGAGSALVARKKFGAIYKQPKGRQGQSYAIVTKNLLSHRQPSVTEYNIVEEIVHLYEYAKNNPDLEFWVVYRADTINLNFYTPDEMAKMFGSFKKIPTNMVFEEGFWNLILKYYGGQ